MLSSYLLIFAEDCRTVNLKKYLILFLMICFAGNLSAQQNQLCPGTENKKAQRHLEDAREARKRKKSFDEIRALLDKAILEDSSWAEPWKYLAELSSFHRKPEVQREAYIRYLNLCPDSEPEFYYKLGLQYFESREYDAAIRSFESYLDFIKVKEENLADAKLRIQRARLMKNPVPFNPELVRDISTADPEYLAVISPDQELCFFTRRFDEEKRGSLTAASVEKFMIAKKNGEYFSKGEPMPPPFNKSSSNNEGGASVSIDNKHLYFTVNRNGNFDIYYSDEIKGKWTEPKSIGEQVNDPKQWDSQPCISPDGRTLYFASFRDSVNKTSDLFVTRKKDGNWGKPEPLAALNTPGNEKTPFLHPDNITLYFSTDGLPGMGGYDIYFSRLKDGKWSAPENIGYPINTEADEIGFFVSTDGKHGYYSSNSLKGSGGYDIYSFDLPETAKPNKVLFIKGELKSDSVGAPFNVQIALKNTLTDESMEVDYDTITGRYASVVRFDQDYIMTVKKQGYAYNSAYFSQTDSLLQSPRTINMEVRKNEIGKAYRLNNILYEKNSADLRHQDSIIIRDFTGYLKDNPRITVAIHGHTDSDGNDNDNLQLSEARARSVYNLIIQSGIDMKRVTYKGYGETTPVADNQTFEGRSLNRRTEFLITGK